MLSIQGIHTLSIFGAETQVTFGLAISIPREFAPLITGILVAGRSGSQLTSRVGSMQLNGEIDALTVMGIAPARYVVAPALIGLIFSLPVLVVIGNLSAFMAAGMYIDAVLGIGPDAYWADVLDVVTLDDFLHGIAKAYLCHSGGDDFDFTRDACFRRCRSPRQEHNRIGGDLYCRDHRCRYCLCAVALGDMMSNFP